MAHCGICKNALGESGIIKTKCGHMFCSDCILLYLRMSNICPSPDCECLIDTCNDFKFPPMQGTIYKLTSSAMKEDIVDFVIIVINYVKKWIIDSSKYEDKKCACCSSEDDTCEYACQSEACQSEREKETCGICLGDIEENNYFITTCGHKFCANCLVEALHHKNTCPMCRRQLMDGKLSPILPYINNSVIQKIFDEIIIHFSDHPRGELFQLCFDTAYDYMQLCVTYQSDYDPHLELSWTENINELRQNITDVDVSLQNIITTDLITNAYIDIITPNIDNNFIANADDLIQNMSIDNLIELLDN